MTTGPDHLSPLADAARRAQRYLETLDARSVAPSPDAVERLAAAAATQTATNPQQTPSPSDLGGFPVEGEIAIVQRQGRDQLFLLDVANGFSRLRLEHVAARAGVGKATIYRRWPSKEALAISDPLAARLLLMVRVVALREPPPCTEACRKEGPMS